MKYKSPLETKPFKGYKKNEASWKQGTTSQRSKKKSVEDVFLPDSTKEVSKIIWLGEKKSKKGDPFMPDHDVSNINHALGADTSSAGSSAGGGEAGGGASESLNKKGKNQMTNQKLREQLNKMDLQALDEGMPYYDLLNLYESLKPMSKEDTDAVIAAAKTKNQETLNNVMLGIQAKTNPALKNKMKATTLESVDDNSEEEVLNEEDLDEGRNNLVAKKCISLETHHIYYSPYDTKEKDFAKFGIRYRYDDKESCLDAINDPTNDLGYGEDGVNHDKEEDKVIKFPEKEDEKEKIAASMDTSTEGELLTESVWLHIEGGNNSEDKEYRNAKVARKHGEQSHLPWSIYKYNELTGDKDEIENSEDTDEDEVSISIDKDETSVDDKQAFLSGKPNPKSTYTPYDAKLGIYPEWINSDGYVDLYKLPDEYVGPDKIDTYFIYIFKLYYYTFIKGLKEIDKRKFAIDCGNAAANEKDPSTGELNASFATAQFKELVKDGFADPSVLKRSNTISGTPYLKKFIEDIPFEPGNKADYGTKKDPNQKRQILDKFKFKDGKNIKMDLKQFFKEPRFKKIIENPIPTAKKRQSASTNKENTLERKVADEMRASHLYDDLSDDEFVAELARKVEETRKGEYRVVPFEYGDDGVASRDEIKSEIKDTDISLESPKKSSTEKAKDEVDVSSDIDYSDDISTETSIDSSDDSDIFVDDTSEEEQNSDFWDDFWDDVEDDDFNESLNEDIKSLDFNSFPSHTAYKPNENIRKLTSFTEKYDSMSEDDKSKLLQDYMNFVGCKDLNSLSNGYYISKNDVAHFSNCTPKYSFECAWYVINNFLDNCKENK